MKKIQGHLAPSVVPADTAVRVESETSEVVVDVVIVEGAISPEGKLCLPAVAVVEVLSDPAVVVDIAVGPESVVVVVSPVVPLWVAATDSTVALLCLLALQVLLELLNLLKGWCLSVVGLVVLLGGFGQIFAVLLFDLLDGFRGLGTELVHASLLLSGFDVCYIVHLYGVSPPSWSNKCAAESSRWARELRWRQQPKKRWSQRCT